MSERRMYLLLEALLLESSEEYRWYEALHKLEYAYRRLSALAPGQ